jgi:pimeloyl-ACP methyl ester carboxylesterase
LAEPREIKKMAKHGLKTINGLLSPKTDPAFTRALWQPSTEEPQSKRLTFPLNEELWQSLSCITCPTLVMKGQASAILSKRTAEKMVNEVLPQASLSIIPRAGHALMVDNPDAFAQQLTDFVAQQV